MSQDDFDRSEEATPYKLQKAREKGQVAKSADVVSVVVLTAAVAYMAWRGGDSLLAQFRFDHALLVEAARGDGSGASLWSLVSHMLNASLELVLPFFLVLMVAGIVGNVMQTGPNLAFEPLKPDIERINPAAGFKRVFSMRSLFDAARACVKLVLLGVVAWLSLSALVPQFRALAGLSAQGTLRLLVDDMSSLGFKMVLILAVIAAIDWMFTHREFAKKMRMSRRELKDEVKNREGDPRIRSRLRELRREMLKRSQSVRRTGDADVVLTNPTHVAVALRYKHGEMESPQLVAKGAGMLATAMRVVAARKKIPVVPSPTLARRLYREVDVDMHVPPSMYAQVARIVVWVFAMRERQHGRPS